VNTCYLLAGFFDFFLPLHNLMLSVRGILSSYQGSYLMGETKMAGLQSDEGHMMIESVVWHNTST